MNLLNKTILYIIDYLQDLEAPISTIRLIKYLYLIDYEHYLRKKEKYSSIDWVRYKFGPYFFEWPIVLNKLSIDLEQEEVLTNQYKTKVFSTLEEIKIEKYVSWTTKNLIENVIEKWAFEDINIILDYIYSDTEPMRWALLNQKLDFTKIRIDFNRKRKTTYLSLTDDESKIVKNRLETKKKALYPKSLEASMYDADYIEGIKQMNLEDSAEININGKVMLNNHVIDFLSSEE